MGYLLIINFCVFIRRSLVKIASEMVDNHNYSYVLILIVVLFSHKICFVDFCFVLLFAWQDTLRLVLTICG